MSGHHHDHSHTPALKAKDINTAFITGIVLNLLYVILEAIAGFYYHSLSLLSDAGHNLSDVASLVLALVAYGLMRARSTTRMTYGYRKLSILASMINGVILFAGIIFIFWESISRLRHPVAVAGGPMIFVAAAGVLVNGISALLFYKGRKSDLNIKGAFLHLAADALVSLGVVLAGIIILFTDWYWLDPVVSMIIGVVILFSTWGLLKESVLLSLEAVPEGVDYEEIKTAMLSEPGIAEVHHLHIWAISTAENALTAHVVLSANQGITELKGFKDRIRHKLAHLNVQHATFEFETVDEQCDDNC